VAADGRHKLAKSVGMADSPASDNRRWRPPPWGPKLAFACLIGLAAIFVSSVRLLPTKTPPPPLPRASDRQGIAGIGRVEPKGEIIDVSAPALMGGAKVERLLVSLGDQVKKGQVIAILDNHERLLRAFDVAKQQSNVAQMRLLQVEAGAKQGEISAQASRIEQLRRELQGQIASQSLSIKRLFYELKNAQTECQRYNKLFTAGAVSSSQRENICVVADTTRQQKLEAQAQLKRTQQTLSQQISEAASNRAAIAEVRPIDVSVAKAEVLEAVARQKEAEANLTLSLVRSPIDGQVLRIIVRDGERVGNEGIVKLGNTKQMTVVAEVYETDVPRLKKGQKATIQSPGLTRTLEGAVSEIGLSIDKQDVLGTDPAAASDARVLEVRIDLSPESSRRASKLTNLQVDVVIHANPL
jgi:HlyD family secretion protein